MSMFINFVYGISMELYQEEQEELEKMTDQEKELEKIKTHIIHLAQNDKKGFSIVNIDYSINYISFGVYIGGAQASYNFEDRSSLKTDPLKEDIEKYKKYYNELTKEEKQFIDQYGEPKVAFYWVEN